MANFFEHLDPETADELERLSRLNYELRENRRALLSAYGADSDAALLQLIRDGAVAEHPVYEHFLAARILAETRETVRALIDERLKELKR